MADDDLTASHWDDVISPHTNQSLSLSRNLNIFTNEFDDFNILDKPNQSNHNSSSNYHSGSYLEPSHNHGHDADEEFTKENKDENNKKLLSELIGPEEIPISETPKISNNDLLFGDTKNIINVDIDADIEHDHKPTKEEKKTSIRGEKLYVQRPRRFKPNYILNGQKSEISSENHLGPLSESKPTKVELPNAPQETTGNNPVEVENNDNNETIEPVLNSSETDNQQSTNKFKIVVLDPIKIGDITSSHIIYTIKTTSIPSNEIFTVSRRYRDFRWIYHQLQNNHPGYIIPPPPSKKTIGRFDENFIENRRLSLEKMLDKCCNKRQIANDEDFKMFLSSEDFQNDSKERERISGSDASKYYDEDDANSGNGGTISGSTSTGGLFNSISNAFSISTKIVETDQFFIDKKNYISELENTLKNFYKSLEFLIQQRNELSVVLVEIGGISNKLSELEISKKNTELLYEFGLNHEKLSEILNRCSVQDMLTLGITIEEYLRLIESIKSVLKQRVESQIENSNIEAELVKRQNQFQKLVKKSNSTNSAANIQEKLKLYEKDLSNWENKYTISKIKNDKLNNVIKDELSKFEIEKNNEFRNSIETYLESLIESQKEGIELWETFYERLLVDV